MSVVKSKRKPSEFEVFHHLNVMRNEVTDLLLRDFGYDGDKAIERILHKVGVHDITKMTAEQKRLYDKMRSKDLAFAQWFIADERKKIVDTLRDITTEVYIANNLYPQYIEELIERRIHQDKAIGLCYSLTQELQYAIETLPVDINKYLRFADLIQTEINLLKAWRTSDKKHRKRLGVTSDSASNFANVNNNGNANNNNASNSNGVRPDFGSAINAT